MIQSISLQRIFTRSQSSQTALVVAASIGVPFVIHFIPVTSILPPGAKLLPMFYAPFIALFLFSPQVSFASALFAPAINSLLTGMPSRQMVFGLTTELLLFTLISNLLLKKFRRFYGNAPCAYLIAQIFFAVSVNQYPTIASKIFNAFPGLIILLLINLFMITRPDHESKNAGYFF